MGNATDDDVRELRHLKYLDSLNLSDSNLTDASIAELKRLQHLKYMDLCRSGVSLAGIGELREALPDAIIAYTNAAGENVYLEPGPLPYEKP
jgi:hypothetical protein